MDVSVSLGRLRGIPIGIHPSWLIVFGLLTYSLTTHVLPSRYAGWSAAEYWVAGTGASVLLFASVLAHELGHAVVAQAKGIPVRSITLFVFGGVAVLDEESEEAGDEFLIAVAGPAVSLAIAIVSAALGSATQDLNEQTAAILRYLASANVLLVAFNLIPGYPLDGGRVLRAIIWGATGSVQRATRIAASIGMVIGYVLAAAGILLVFQAVVSGIWLAAIGFFLWSAAKRSERQFAHRRAFAGVRVGALMDRPPVAVAPDVPLDELVGRYVLTRNVRGLPVVDGGNLVGIITLTDLKGVPTAEWGRLRVRDRFTPRERLVTATPATSLDDVLRIMSERDIHQVPVVQDGALVGVLTRGAVSHFLQLRQELPASATESSNGRLHRGGPTS